MRFCCNYFSRQEKDSFADIFSRTSQKHAFIPAQHKLAGRSVNLNQDFRLSPLRIAAAAAPVDPVPELLVSPAPLSKKHLNSVANPGLGQKTRWTVSETVDQIPLPQPIDAPVFRNFFHKNGALRIADIQNGGINRPGARGFRQRSSPPVRGRPISISKTNFVLLRSFKVRSFRPAAVVIAT